MSAHKIGVIGLGNFGTALAHWVSHWNPVLGWSHSVEVSDEINSRHTNEKYLPNYNLHPDLRSTTDISEVIAFADILLLCIPARHVASFYEMVPSTLLAGKTIINTTKGMDLAQNLPVFYSLKRFYTDSLVLQLGGPMVANEFSRGSRTQGILTDGEEYIQKLGHALFDNTPIVITYSHDFAGVVWGSILKNIYTIGLGVLEATAPENMNLRGVYISNAFAEMVTFATAQGAEEKTLFGLAGLGDFLATSMSTHSHNRHFGCHIVNLDYGSEFPGLPEGYFTLKALSLSPEYELDTYPIAASLWKLINRQITLIDWHARIMEK